MTSMTKYLSEFSEGESHSHIAESLFASSLVSESVAMPAGKDADGKRMHTHMMFAKKKEVASKKKSKRPMSRFPFWRFFNVNFVQ